MAVPEAVDLVDLALRATTAYQRPDLSAKLRHARGRLADPSVRVLVVGEFKQGKSQLVNALVNASVCPVDDDIATSLPTAVRYAETPGVTLVREAESDSGEPLPAERSEVPIEQLAQYVSEAGNPGNRRQLTYAEVGIPRKLLAGGLVLVDTPGVGGLGSTHGAATMGALPRADAVLLVSDAAQEYTKPELDFLEAARRLCPNVACVITKTDLYPQWRRIVELDTGHLGRAGMAAEIFPVSSTLRLHALRLGRAEDADEAAQQAMMDESGYVALIGYLRRGVLGRADELDRRSVGQDVLAVCDQLAAGMRSELSASENPEQAAALITRLTEAKGVADELRQRSARWQQTLNDGVQDLTADIEHDLRDRMRSITREAEQSLETNDPKDTWDQFAAWVEQQVSEAATANFVWAIERARWLAGQVADHFNGSGVESLPDLDYGQGDFRSGELRELRQPVAEAYGVGQKLFTGLRGGYGGLVMIGLATGLAGMSLMNPLSIGAGLLFGAKTVHDEMKRNKQRRQSEAKAAVRKHIDDVVFQVGKDTRDMLRQVQRALRDHFTTLAEELHTSLTEAVSSAQKAVKSEESQRSGRAKDLRAELDRVDALARRARALAGGRGAADGAREAAGAGAAR